MDENGLRKFVREVAEETKGNIVVADFAVAVAAKAVAAEREAWGNPRAWMNAEGMVSSAPGGGYDIPLHSRSNVDVTGPRLRGSGGQEGSAAPEPSSGD